MSERLLTVEGLVAGYAAPVVGPVSFHVDAGEIVGVAGPNGAGKSTLLGALAGTARVFGGTATTAPGARVEVQRQRPVRPAEAPIAARDVLRLTHAKPSEAPETLRPLLRTRIDRLSGGQFQLLSVWACLGSPARLVYLDEPTNNMDAATVDALAAALTAARDARGVVVVSHEADFLARVADRVVEVGR